MECCGEQCENRRGRIYHMEVDYIVRIIDDDGEEREYSIVEEDGHLNIHIYERGDSSDKPRRYLNIPYEPFVFSYTVNSKPITIAHDIHRVGRTKRIHIEETSEILCEEHRLHLRLYFTLPFPLTTEVAYTSPDVQYHSELRKTEDISTIDNAIEDVCTSLLRDSDLFPIGDFHITV